MPLLKIPSGGDVSPQVTESFEDFARAIGEVEKLASGGSAGGLPPGSYIVMTDNDGVPAAINDDNPGVGWGIIRQVYGDPPKIRTGGQRVRLINIARGSTGVIAPNKQVATMPILGKPGHQLVILDPCVIE